MSTIPRLKEEVFKDSRYVTGVEFWKNSRTSAVLVKGNVKWGNADLYEEILERFNVLPGA